MDAANAISAVSSRGPDAMDSLTIEIGKKELILGHARLSIYDLSQNARQPMKRENLVAVFNGALYNFKEIRKELESKGYEFSTESDTETLLISWQEWGPKCLRKFEGMFALILYDEIEKKLYLARDRFGEKPLHIFSNGGKIAFASEINQFFEAKLLSEPKIDRNIARRFLDFGISEAGEQTFFVGVKRLLPNKWACYQISDNEVSLIETGEIFEPLYQLTKSNSDYKAKKTNLRNALVESVKQRLVADVKVGACLSGGIDSSAIVRIASQLLPKNEVLECICAVFDEIDIAGNDLSERKYALAASDLPNLRLHFVDLGSENLPNLINDILRRQGEPFAHSSIIAQYKVFEKARDLGLKVMLDGQGADEIFAGYSGMAGAALSDILFKYGIRQVSECINELIVAPSDFDKKSLKLSIGNTIIPERMRRIIARLRGKWPSELQITNSEMDFAPKKIARISYLDSLIVNLLENLSLPSLLRYEDRNAMSFGVETRLPFLDSKVIESAFDCDGLDKLKNGLTKAVLRDAMSNYLPKEIASRRKKLGFITPQDKWMETILKNWCEEGAKSAYLRACSILNIGKAKRLMSEIGKSTSINNTIFRLAILGHFLELYDANV